MCAANGGELPDQWIHPHESRVVRLKCADLDQTVKFKTGVSPRFPRVDAFRTDKPWHECMTVDELMERFEREKKRQKRVSQGDMDAHEEQGSNKRAKRTATAHVSSVMPQFRLADVKEVSTVSQCLAGLDVCVLAGGRIRARNVDGNNVNGSRGVGEEVSKGALECMVAEMGGTVVAVPRGDAESCVVVAGSQHDSVRVRNVINARRWDVVLPQWLADCRREPSGCRRLPLKPAYMVFTTERTQETFADVVDKYGDVFDEDLTEDSLATILENVGVGGSLMSFNRIRQLEEKFHAPPLSLFRLCCCVVVGADATSVTRAARARLAAALLKFNGAQMCDDAEDVRVTHFVVDPSAVGSAAVNALLEGERRRTAEQLPRRYIVDVGWTDACLAAGKLLDERKFALTPLQPLSAHSAAAATGSGRDHGGDPMNLD